MNLFLAVLQIFFIVSLVQSSEIVEYSKISKPEYNSLGLKKDRKAYEVYKQQNEKISCKIKYLYGHLILEIGRYLSCPQRSLGFINRYTNRLLFEFYPFKDLIIERYPLLDMTECREDDLFWFFDPIPPRADLMKSRQYIVSLTEALTNNSAFLYNGPVIAANLLRFILESGEEDRNYFSTEKVLSDSQTVIISLGRYFIRLHQFDMLFSLYEMYPLDVIDLFTNKLNPYNLTISDFKDVQIFLQKLGYEHYKNILTKCLDGFHFKNNQKIQKLGSILFFLLSDPKDFVLKALAELSFRFNLDLHYFIFDSFELFCTLNLRISRDKKELEAADLYFRNINLLTEIERIFVIFAQDQNPNPNLILMETRLRNAKELNRIRFGLEDYELENSFVCSSAFKIFAMAAVRSDKEKMFRSLFVPYVSNRNERLDDSLMEAMLENQKYAEISVEIMRGSPLLERFLNFSITRNCDESIMLTIVKGMGYRSIDEFNSLHVIYDSHAFDRLKLTVRYTNDQMFEKIISKFTDMTSALQLCFDTMHIKSDESLKKFIASLEKCVDLNAIIGSGKKYSSRAILANHTAILRVYNIESLRIIFTIFDIKMDSDSILTVIRSSGLRKQFDNKIKECISFDCKQNLRYLRSNSEFKAFISLTKMDIYSHLVSGPASNIFKTSFFYQNRTAFLYWIDCGSSVDIFWTQVSNDYLKLLLLDVPYQLKRSFYSYFNPISFTCNEAEFRAILNKFLDIFGESEILKIQIDSPERKKQFECEFGFKCILDEINLRFEMVLSDQMKK